MELKDVVKKVIRYNKNARIELIEKAYRFSDNILKEKIRKSGKKWIEHYVEAADEAANLKLDDAGIAAALMHGITTKGADKKEIKKEFGDEIFNILDNIEKMSEIKRNVGKKNVDDEDLRKVILAASRDLRALLIKICDKLVNLREVDCLSENERKRIAKECMNIYAPLAYRLGMGKLKSELEDLAFKQLDEKHYREIETAVAKTRKDGEKTIYSLKKKIEDKLKENVLNADVEARIKHIYSIYKKAIGKSYSAGNLMDIVGIRVITENADECYRALKIIHENFRPVQNRFKDYIAMPKPNGYQSLHTSVFDENRRIFEVQIRTREMHENAEEGIAAHFSYKKAGHGTGFDKRLSWLKNIVEDRERFLDINIGFFGDEIFVFTPQGQAIELPKNATVIDFAYYIHSDVGDHCSGASINGNFSSIKTIVNNGDVVEIIKSKTQTPSREWLKCAATKKARDKIKQFLKNAGKITTRNYFTKTDEKKGAGDGLIKFKSDRKMTTKLAMCCKPVPGNLITGIVSNKTKVMIHNKECDEIKKTNRSRIDVEWVDRFSRPVEIIVDAVDRPGLFKEVLNIISRTGINVTKTSGKTVNKEYSEFSFLTDAKDSETLINLIKMIKKTESVRKVYVNV